MKTVRFLWDALMRKLDWKKRLLHSESSKILSVLLLSLLEGSMYFGNICPDSAGYIRLARFFNGKEESFPPYRMLRPLIPLLASVLNHVVDIATAFGIINIALWLTTSYIMFRLSKDLLEDNDLAWYASILFSTSLPLIRYGTAVLTDMAGFFFVICIFWMTRKYNRTHSILKYLIIGITVGIGILGREVVFACLPFFVLSEISGQRTRNQYLKILLTVLTALLPPLLWSVAFGLDYLEWFMFGGVERAGGWAAILDLKELVSSILLAFTVLCPFLVTGFLEEEDRSKILFYCWSFLSVLAVLIVWPVKDYRFAFLLSPCFIPLSAKGIDVAAGKLNKKPLFRTVKPSFWKILVLASYALYSNYRSLLGG